MGQFLWPDWKPLPLPSDPDADAAPPPADPEQAIADNTRAEEALNQFIAARQAALFEAPDAFYRTQGSDAIHAAPVILDRLSRLRDDSLDSLANDAQRDRLGSALDAHLQLARDDIARHVAEQSLAWQRKTAQDRIGLLTKEAAYHHNDDELVDALGHAASNAARAHARVGGTPLDPQAEDAAAAFARSGVLGAAIKARLDRGDMAGANTLFTRVGDQLDGEHAAPLLAQFDPADKSGATHQFSTNADTPPQSGTQIAQAASSDKKLDQRAKSAPSPTPSPRSAVQTRRDAEWSAIATGLPTSYDGSKLQDTLPDNWQPEVDKVQGKIYAPSYKPPPESAYSEITRQAAEKHGIPPLLLARLINRESSYDPLSGVSLTRESALSPIPGTRRYGANVCVSCEGSRHNAQAIGAG